LQPPQLRLGKRLQHHFPPEFSCATIQESRVASNYPVG
jgi:hypothetical protein